MPFYRWKNNNISSLTLTDTSRFMLFHAKQKVPCLYIRWSVVI